MPRPAPGRRLNWTKAEKKKKKKDSVSTCETALPLEDVAPLFFFVRVCVSYAKGRFCCLSVRHS